MKRTIERFLLVIVPSSIGAIGLIWQGRIIADAQRVNAALKAQCNQAAPVTAPELTQAEEVDFLKCRADIQDIVEHSPNFDKAKDLGTGCIARFNLTRIPDKFADITYWIGRAYEASGHPVEAFRRYDAAYSAASTLQDRAKSDRMEVDNLLGRASVLKTLCQPKEAEDDLREMLSRAKRLTYPIDRDTYVRKACELLGLGQSCS